MATRGIQERAGGARVSRHLRRNPVRVAQPPARVGWVDRQTVRRPAPGPADVPPTAQARAGRSRGRAPRRHARASGHTVSRSSTLPTGCSALACPSGRPFDILRFLVGYSAVWHTQLRASCTPRHRDASRAGKRARFRAPAAQPGPRRPATGAGAVGGQADCEAARAGACGRAADGTGASRSLSREELRDAMCERPVTRSRGARPSRSAVLASRPLRSPPSTFCGFLLDILRFGTRSSEPVARPVTATRPGPESARVSGHLRRNSVHVA
jgi:hypothetical protein